MADLQKKLIQLGFSDIQTYIQSGNLIFTSKKSSEELEMYLEIFNAENYGFEVPVIVRNKEEIEQAVLENPYFKVEGDVERLHLSFLKSAPDQQKIQMAQNAKIGNDKFEVIGNNAFIYCNAGYSKSKLTNKFFEDKLKVIATTRNWKTVLKLLELAKKFQN